MNQGGASHALCECDHILRAHHIGAQGTFERGIKSNVTGAVEDHVDIIGDCLCLLIAVTKICLGDVATQYDYLIANESIQCAAVTFAQGIERRRGNDAVPKTHLRLFLGSCPNRDVDTSNIRKAMQQHAERDFPQEAGASDQKEFSLIKYFSRR